MSMGASPEFKVYNKAGEYRACCKDAAEAAVLVAFLGDGAKVRWLHGSKWVLWHEGAEDSSAAESYDHAAEVMLVRRDSINAEQHHKTYARSSCCDKKLVIPPTGGGWRCSGCLRLETGI